MYTVGLYQTPQRAFPHAEIANTVENAIDLKPEGRPDALRLQPREDEAFVLSRLEAESH